MGFTTYVCMGYGCMRCMGFTMYGIFCMGFTTARLGEPL